MARRTYTPEERARVLALLKGGAAVKRVARETTVPESTVRMWRDNPDAAAPLEVRAKAEEDLGAEIDRVRRLYLAQAGKEDVVSKERGYFAVQSVQKLTEVHQLLTGGPTQRIDSTQWGRMMTEIRDSRLSVRVLDGGRALEDGKERSA